MVMRNRENSHSKSTRLKQVSLQNTVEFHKLWDIIDLTVKKIHAKVDRMIAINYKPVSIVDHKGFMSLISIVEPKYRVPGRKYFSVTIIPSVANRIRTNIVTQLKEGTEYSSPINDCWSQQ